MKARDFIDTIAAASIGSAVCFFVARGIYETVEPAAAPHATNVVESIPVEWQDRLEIYGNARFYTNTFTNHNYTAHETLTHFRTGSTNAYEVPSKSRVQADTNDAPSVTFTVATNSIGMHGYTFSENFRDVDDPNEAKILYYGKDGSVWTPTWTKK